VEETKCFEVQIASNREEEGCLRKSGRTLTEKKDRGKSEKKVPLGRDLVLERS